MMNPHEQRELAHPFWKYEGCPSGHEYRRWAMACTLVSNPEGAAREEGVIIRINNVIVPEEPFDPNPKPEIDPAPPQPELPEQPEQPEQPPQTHTKQG